MGESELWSQMVTKSSEESIVSGEVSPECQWMKGQYI